MKNMKNAVVKSVTEDDAQSHIAALQKDRSMAIKNTNTVFNTLENLIDTVFNRNHRFAFEFLQNADDVSQGDASVEASFVLQGDYLIFSHNGKHFDENNVEKICDHMNPEDEKATDLEKTGYKGIGFKSIFAVSDWVAIFSNAYKFRFDKEKSYKKINRVNLPWQIIPVWTPLSELSKNVRDAIDVNHVNFVIRIKDQKKVKAELEALQQDPKVLLFLRHVRKLTIKTEDEIKTIELTVKDTIKKLTVDGVTHSTWLCQPLLIDIPESVHKAVQALGSQECPSKIKNAKQISLHFAAQIKKHQGKTQFVQLNNAPLYCYLPTKVDLNLPFYVNADFILDAKRNSLQENPWNQFLVKEIAYQQFRWYEMLAGNASMKYDLFALFAKAQFGEMHESFTPFYEKGFTKGIEEIAFIPCQSDEDILLTLGDAVWDQTGIYAKLEIEDETTDALINEQMNHTDRLAAVMDEDNILNKAKIIKNLPYYASCDNSPEYHVKLNHFIHKLFNDGQHNEELKQTAFVLRDNNELVSPVTLYIKSEEDPKPPSFLNLPCLHAELAQDATLVKWLTHLEANPCSPINIVNGNIVAMIAADSITNKNTRAITRYIISVFNSADRPKLNRQALGNMKVLTASGDMKPLDCTYLADSYQPQPLLETVFRRSKQVILSSLYRKETESTQLWRRFFSYLGAHASLQPLFVERINYSQLIAKKDYFPAIDDYLKLCTSHASANQSLRYLVTLPLMTQLSNPDFAALFWESLLTQWDKINDYFDKTSYALTRVEKPLADKPYLIHYLKTNKCVVAQDGNAYKIDELYSPSMAPHISACIPKTANITTPMTEQQAKRLGFRTTLALADCFTLIDYMVTQYPKSQNKEALLEHCGFALSTLLKHCRNDATTNAPVVKWLTKATFIALDGSVQPLSGLKIHAVEGVLPSTSPQWMVKLPNLTKADTVELAGYLKLTVIESEHIRLDIGTMREDNDMINWFKDRLVTIAVAESYHTHCPPKKRIPDLLTQLQQLHCYSVDTLQLNYNDGKSRRVSVYLKEHDLYVCGRWKSAAIIPDVRNTIGRYLGIHPDLLPYLESIFTKEFLPSDKTRWLQQQGVDDDLINQIDALESSMKTLTLDEPIRSTKIPTVGHKSTTSGYPHTPETSDDEDNNEVMALLEDEETSSAVLSKNSATPSKQQMKKSPEKPATATATSTSTSTTASLFGWLRTPDKLVVSDKKIASGITPGYRSPRLHAKKRLGNKANNKLQQQPQNTDEHLKISSAKGYWGEKWVFEKLKADYKTYPDCTRKVEMTEDGFKLQITLSTEYLQSEKVKPRHKQKYKSGTIIEYDVEWVNNHLTKGKTFPTIQKECEYVLEQYQQLSADPYDLCISKKVNAKPKKEKRYIDVKSTEFEDKRDLHISKDEWTVMRKFGNHYSIFRVYNTGDNKRAYCQEFKNPFASLVSGDLSPGDVTLKL